MKDSTRIMLCEYNSATARMTSSDRAWTLRKLVLAYGGRCESIPTDDGVELWGIFDSDEVAALFKLTHV